MFVNSVTITSFIIVSIILYILLIAMFLYDRHLFIQKTFEERKEYLNRLMAKDLQEFEDIGTKPGKVKSSFADKKKKTGTPFNDI